MSENLPPLSYSQASQNFMTKYQVNENLLQSNKFVFVCTQAPFLNLFSQTAFIPGMSQSIAIQDTPHNTIPHFGDKLDYDTLDVDFLVDEDIRVFEEIKNWMEGLTGPESPIQVRDQQRKGFYSDIHLLSSTNSETDNLTCVFKSAFPVSLGPVNLAHTSEDTYITSTVQFAYESYEIRR